MPVAGSLLMRLRSSLREARLAEQLKVLVLGRQGQLARSLAERGGNHMEIHFVARPELDLEDEGSIARCLEVHRPDVIVNAAAYTAVDRAETETDRAERINAVAPRLIAAEAQRLGARLIHVSTDYVFDGTSPAGYIEDAPLAPLNAYGRTKLAGEQGVRDAHPQGHVIVRTSWVYSPFGGNFVKTMLNLARSRPSINVVDDQVGTPTSALDLADGLLAAIGRWQTDPMHGLGATYHLAGTGHTSWAKLARHALESSRDQGGPAADIVPITTEQYPTPAARPRFSILDSSKFQTTFGYSAPPWQRSVAAVVDRILREDR